MKITILSYVLIPLRSFPAKRPVMLNAVLWLNARHAEHSLQLKPCPLPKFSRYLSGNAKPAPSPVYNLRTGLPSAA